MTSSGVERRPKVETAVVVHPVRPRDAALRTPEQRLEEAVGLAEALDLKVREALLAPVRRAAPSTLFGRGKVDELATVCAGLEVDVVVVDDALTPVQQRNLERAWKVKVIDRTGLVGKAWSRGATPRVTCR